MIGLTILNFHDIISLWSEEHPWRGDDTYMGSQRCMFAEVGRWVERLALTADTTIYMGLMPVYFVVSAVFLFCLATQKKSGLKNVNMIKGISLNQTIQTKSINRK